MYRDSGTGNLTIDLSGPDGNAFALAGYARNLARQLDKDPTTVANKMLDGDYANVLRVFRETFPMVDLINDPTEELS